MSETEKSSNVLLPLDEPRVISFRVGSRRITYMCNRIKASDWLRYFRGIINQVLSHGGHEERVYESTTAAIQLTDAVTRIAEGYESAAPIDRRPAKHRAAVAQVLGAVSAESVSETGENVAIKLTAAWTSDENGKTKYYTDLIHTFRAPSIDQLKRWNFENARVQVEGSSGEGVTRYPSRLAIAASMYDELIVSVSGYSFKGAPVEDLETVKAEMDAMHKAMAVLELFAGGDAIDIG